MARLNRLLRPRLTAALVAVAAALAIAIAAHAGLADATPAAPGEDHSLLGDGAASGAKRVLTPLEIEAQLQECPLVQYLNSEKIAHAHLSQGVAATVFKALFPGSPAVNALLATLYISGPPNFLLAACPPNIDPSSLSVMVAFAVGGLLGDTLFHLLPEIFVGEDSPFHVRFVMVEPNRNLLLGLAILSGFVTFVAMDKILRIVTGGSGHSHEHEHEHGLGHKHATESTATTTAVTASGLDGNAAAPPSSARQRRTAAPATATTVATTSATATPASPSVKLGGYLNLIADFTHNITDGLALSSSFYASPTIGATTTVAVFFHEIPHEVGDFALLIQSGFSKRKAMGAQFVTALGALLGTVIGICVQELGSSVSAAAAATPAAATDMLAGSAGGILGTSLTPSDLLLPWTAGTFLYVGTVSVIPELLETGRDARVETVKAIKQFLALAAGAGIMLLISWH